METAGAAVGGWLSDAKPLWQWLFCAGLFLVFWGLDRLYRYKSVNLLLRLVKRLRGTQWEELLRALAPPTASFFLLLGLYLPLYNLPIRMDLLTPLRGFLGKAAMLGCIGILGWLGCAAVEHAPAFKFSFLGTAEAVRRMLRRTLKVLVIVFAVLAAAEGIGLPVSSLVAGLGLGGLTISLAAKDSASNFFAGLVLLVEKPFAIGDWITCAGTEGTVEDISFRSTKIRTMANTLTVVPNTVISAGLIINGSQRTMRMEETTLTVCYGTPRAALEQLMNDLRTLLGNDTDLHGELTVVRFAGFSASSMDILVRYYTKTADYNEFLAVRERLNLAILELFARDGVQFAFPSTTVYLEQPSKS